MDEYKKFIPERTRVLQLLWTRRMNYFKRMDRPQATDLWSQLFLLSFLEYWAVCDIQSGILYLNFAEDQRFLQD